MTICKWVLGLALGSVVLVVGCSDEQMQKALESFRTASDTLATAYEGFVQGANAVEEEHAIDGMVIERAAFDEKALAAKNLYSPEQIKLRAAAINALGAYTATLAELESGKAAKGLETDAATASTNVSTLDTDLQAAVTSHFGSSPDLLAGPISSAVAAAGSVLKLIEERKGRAEVKKAIAANDPAVEKLFGMISTESRELYERQKQSLSLEEVAIVQAFDAEAARGASADGAKMVALGERLKRVRRKMGLQSAADPRAAIAAFQKTHSALIAVVTGDSGKKGGAGALAVNFQTLIDEVGPLAGHVQMFVGSF